MTWLNGRGQVRGRDGLRGSIRRLHPGIHGFFQGSERSPWQRSSVGRRPRQILCPEGIPSHCAGGKLLSARQHTAAEILSQGRGGICAGTKGCYGRSASFRRNSEEEAAKTNSIQQAAPSSVSHPRSLAEPASATFPGGGSRLGNLSFGRERGRRRGRMPKTEQRSRRSSFSVSHPPPEPGLQCDPHLRRAPGPGFPVEGIAQRLG